jgi:hypothetical protein
MIEPLESIKTSISKKAGSPFFAAYITVWFVRNWELVFTLINFQEDDSRIYKVAWIKNYLQRDCFFLDVLINVGCTIALLIISYSLISLTKLIVGFFIDIVIPRVQKFTDSSKVVL